MTKRHFVPHVGSTTQCDAGPARKRSDGGGGQDKQIREMNTYHPYHLLFIHPLPTAWYSPLSQGEKVGARLLQEYCGYNFTAPADCPPETGGTRSEATEGVDKTFPFSPLIPLTAISLPRRFRKGLDYQRATSYHATAGLSLATRDDFAELRAICRSAACDKFC